MRTPLVVLAAFIAAAFAGVLLLLVSAAAMHFIEYAVARHTHPGLGAQAGGISEFTVLFISLLCGIFGATFSVYRLERRQR